MNWKPMAAALAMVFFLGAADADAWSWPWNWKRKSDKKKLPTPIDSPIVRPKNPEHHKPGNRARHQKKYDRPEWGAEWDKTLTVRRPHQTYPWVRENIQ